MPCCVFDRAQVPHVATNGCGTEPLSHTRAQTQAFLHPLASHCVVSCAFPSFSSCAQLASRPPLLSSHPRRAPPPPRLIPPPPIPSAPIARGQPAPFPAAPALLSLSILILLGFLRACTATPPLILACWFQGWLLSVWPVGYPPVGEVFDLDLIRSRRVQ